MPIAVKNLLDELSQTCNDRRNLFVVFYASVFSIAASLVLGAAYVAPFFDAPNLARDDLSHENL
jgi:hypothetical protein